MLYRSNRFSALLAVVSICNLWAEVAVSYAPYGADEVVITVGKHKISAQLLAKYGLEPVKVTIQNDQDTDLIFRTDRKCTSIDEAYTCLGYGFVSTFIKVHASAASIATILSLGIWHTIDPWYAQTRKFLNGVAESAAKICSNDEHGTRLEILFRRMGFAWQKGEQYAQDFCSEENLLEFCKAHWPKGLALFAILTGLSIMELGYFYCAYTYNVSLYSYLQAELFSNELIVPPHQTVTKLILIKKMEKKDAAV